MKAILLGLVLLVSVAGAGEGLPTQPYIYVQGQAEQEEKADLVHLQFTLAAVEAEPGAANRAVQAQATKVFALLKATGLDDTDTVAADLESEPEYEEDPNTGRRGKLVGYKVSRDFYVKVRNIAKFPKLVDDLLALKVAEFSNIREDYSKAKELKEAVTEKALAKARDRAEKVAKAAGMKIDSVWAISPVAFPEIHPAIFGGDPERHAVAYSMAAEAKMEPSEYRLAPVKVSETVHVIFLMSPVK